ncbi:unnamed protein product [Cercospora beticola]|nr:unnamed protein product [Cercospora beticola]
MRESWSCIGVRSVHARQTCFSRRSWKLCRWMHTAGREQHSASTVREHTEVPQEVKVLTSRRFAEDQEQQLVLYRSNSTPGACVPGVLSSDLQFWNAGSCGSTE